MLVHVGPYGAELFSRTELHEDVFRLGRIVYCSRLSIDLWNGEALRAEEHHCRRLARHDQSERLSYWVWNTSHESETIPKLDEECTI